MVITQSQVLRKDQVAGGTKSYIIGFDQTIAEQVGNLGGDGEVYFYHHDNLGSTTAITDVGRNVVMQQDYMPFGEDLFGRLDPLRDKVTDVKYTGQIKDSTISLSYYNARYYDSEIGRFTREDTYRGELSRPQTLNLYVYVLNQPLLYIDPTGHNEIKYRALATKYSVTTTNPTPDGFQAFVKEWERKNPPAELDLEMTLILIGMVNEPVDWGVTIHSWSQGDFSYYDIAGFFPIISGQVARKIGNTCGIFSKGNKATNIMDTTSDIAQTTDNIIDAGDNIVDVADNSTDLAKAKEGTKLSELKAKASTVVTAQGKGILAEMLNSNSAKIWGTLADGTNQGVKHFNHYWELYPERIPSLAKRLGVDPNDFENTVQGFENFTNSAKNVINTYTLMRTVGDKTMYFVEGAEKAKKGVAVIVQNGKIQTMMPTSPKDFLKLQ